MRFKGKTLAIRDIARELNVDAVIDGSVLRSGQSVRIDAKLVLGANDQNVWAKSYDRDLQDVLSLLRDVSAAIAGEVRARVAGATAAAPAAAPAVMTPGSSPGLPPPPRVRPEAYEAFLRARYLFSQSLAPAQMAAAREQALLATTLDPSFAAAWAGLSATYAVDALFGHGARAKAVTMARETARKALDLSPDEGSALAIEGMLQLYFDWDFDAAGKKLERAVTLRPHEAMLRHGWADYLMVKGRYDESLEQTRLGRSSDPASPVAAMVAVFHAMAARRFDDVVGDGRRALLLDPSRATFHRMIGQALWQQKKYDEAVAELRVAAGSTDRNWPVFEETYRRLGPTAALRAYASLVAAELAKQGDRTPISVAEAFAEAGDRERAIDWLERAYAAREPGVLHIPGTVAFESLRQEPRFQDLLRRAGLRMPTLPAGSATRRP
jgi:tetratricopeptide (TPR) repeat protein